MLSNAIFSTLFLIQGETYLSVCLQVSKITLIILEQNFMDFGDNVEQSQRKTYLVLA